MDFYSIFYWSLIVFVVVFEIIRKKKSKVDSFTLFSFSFLLSYLLPAALWASIPDLFSNDLPYQLFYNASSKPEVLLVLLLAYGLLTLSYSIFSSSRIPIKIQVSPVKTNAIHKRVVFLMISFSLLVFIGISLLGGVSEFIQAGLEARHNNSGYGVVGYFRYFYSAFSMILVALVLMLLYRKKLHVPRVYTPVLIVVFVLSFIALVANGGRGALIGIFINIVFFLYMINFIKFRLKFVLMFGLVLYFLLFIALELHSISNAIVNNRDVDMLVRIAGFNDRLVVAILHVFQYSAHYLFLIVEWFNRPEAYDYPRLFSDNITAFILLIPGVDLSSVGLLTVPDEISKYVMGKTNGSIPPGWIGWALLNGGFIWLIVKVIYSAFVMAVVDKTKSCFLQGLGYYWGSYFYFVFVSLILGFLFVGSASNLIRGKIGLILFFMLLFLLPFYRIVRLKIVLNGQGSVVNEH